MFSGLDVFVSFLTSHNPNPLGARRAAPLTSGNKFNEQHGTRQDRDCAVNCLSRQSPALSAIGRES